MIDATTLLFGLPGVRVERVERGADGIRVVHVVTDEPTAAACPSCGVVSTSVKERVTTSPKDIPYGEDPIAVRWAKTRWRCQHDYCQRRSFTEAITEVPARARTTGRLRMQIGAAIGEAARSVAEVAAAHRVSWPTAHRAFIVHAQAQLAEPKPTAIIGIDETRRGKPRWQRCALTGRVGAGRPVGHRVRRFGRRSGPTRTMPGPHRRRRHRMALATLPAVPRGDRLCGHRPGRGLRGGDPHRGCRTRRSWSITFMPRFGLCRCGVGWCWSGR